MFNLEVFLQAQSEEVLGFLKSSEKKNFLP